MESEGQQFLEALRIHQYEVPLKASNRDQLAYMLQLVQASEAKGEYNSTQAGISSMLTRDEILVLKQSIISKLES